MASKIDYDDWLDRNLSWLLMLGLRNNYLAINSWLSYCEKKGINPKIEG